MPSCRLSDGDRDDAQLAGLDLLGELAVSGDAGGDLVADQGGGGRSAPRKGDIAHLGGGTPSALAIMPNRM